MAGEERATFRLDLEGNVTDVSDEMADAQEKLRSRLERGESALKSMEQAYKRLQGASVVNIDAARQLQQRMQAQKDSLAQLHGEALKMGTSYDKLQAAARKAAAEKEKAAKKFQAADEKKAKEQTDALGGALRAVSPRIADVKERWGAFAENLKKSGGLMNVAAIGVVGLTEALVAAAVAAVALGVAAVIAFTKFVVEAGNAQRSAMLLRAAVAGSADNTQHLGNQVDLLASKIPTAKTEINDLAIALRKSGLTGDTLVDTLNAVGQASAAVGPELGNKLKEMVDRSKLTGRFAIGPMEPIGSGLNFDEIASSLAKNLNVSIGEARLALVQGRVKLADGAAALRTAVEAKFGKINAAKMLDLDTQVAKLKENLQALVKDVNLEPLLKNVKQIFDLFSQDTVTGQAIQHLVTLLGRELVGAVGESTPILETFIKGLVLGALTLENKFLRLRIAMRDTFGDPKLQSDILDLNTVLMLGKGIMYGLALTTLFVGGSFAWFTFQILGAVKAVQQLVEWGKKAVPTLTDMANPLGKGSGMQKAGADMGSKLKTGFKDALGWHSPPKFFVEAREASEEAFASKPFSPTVESPAAAPSGARAGGASMVKREYHFHVTSEKAAQAMKEPSFLARLTKAIEDAELEAGMPIEGEPA